MGALAGHEAGRVQPLHEDVLVESLARGLRRDLIGRVVDARELLVAVHVSPDGERSVALLGRRDAHLVGFMLVVDGGSAVAVIDVAAALAEVERQEVLLEGAQAPEALTLLPGLPPLGGQAFLAVLLDFGLDELGG